MKTTPGNKLPIDLFQKAMNDDGYVIFESALTADFADKLTASLEQAYESHRPIQLRNGLGELTDGGVQHLLERDSSFIEFLSLDPVGDYLQSYFGSPHIINTFCGVTNVKSLSANTFFRHMHRDVRSFMGANPYMINMLVMLDAFTLENGATFLLRGSHRTPARPAEEDFLRTADRAVGPRGSIVLWNSDIWHAAGENTTDLPRRALGITWTKPYLKQQFDYPRYLGYDYGDTLPEHVRQAIGYRSRVPATLEEWYQPRESRMYQPDQG